MEHRLVLNNRTNTEITNDDMCGMLYQQLKFQKFRRVPMKNGKTIFYLFFRKEEDTYASLQAAKSIKTISLVRYCPAKPFVSELPFQPFPPQRIIDFCQYAFIQHLDKFNNVVGNKILCKYVYEKLCISM